MYFQYLKNTEKHNILESIKWPVQDTRIKIMFDILFEVLRKFRILQEFLKETNQKKNVTNFWKKLWPE